MKIRSFTHVAASVVLGAGMLMPAVAQEANIPSTGANLAAIPARVVNPVDDSRLVRLQGNTHPMARPEFDRGPVNRSLPMERMMLLLKRSPQQEAALSKFMEEQVDPKSANFHHWLTPEEFGATYGPSEYDIQAVTNWLQNHGFTVDQVTKGRTVIEFSGDAGRVQDAFHTEIHHFVVNGEEHVANTVDPQIPEALTPVVHGIVSLHNFFAKPLHKYLGDMKRDAKSGKWMPLNPDVISKPLYGVPGTSPQFELVSPFDFATIYNVTPLWNAGITGAGQTIAIAGRSDISMTDVQTFRSAFGLPVNNPTFIVNGADPGIPSAGDKVENTLDVEWSGAVAKNATIKFVTTKSTNTSDGAAASASYIINNNVAKVMSFSYGACELAFGTSGNAYYNSLWQQGAAQGISEFVASGDQGAAACDGGGTPPYEATQGLAVSATSSTPYNIAVGGTDFDWENLTTKTYWSTTNATNGSNVLSYIPEIPWNGTCASPAVDLYWGFTGAGFGPEQSCEYIKTNLYDVSFDSVTGGTGGKSSCTTPSGTTPATCAGGYAKPSWQSGTGVPADGKRDVPDLSLFAASGALNDAYAICDSDSAPCTYSNTNDALSQAVGGTSVASPAMAGIMALVNQKMGAAQGNANVAFYALAAKDNRANCNAMTVAGGNTCNFYDITTDNNAVPCDAGTPNCVIHHTGDTIGILSGNSSTTGFDLTTGLGSVNANNLVNNWASVVGGTPAVTLTPTTLTFASTNVGVTTAAQVVTVKNSGTAALTLTSETITGTNASSFLKSATTCTTSLAVGASCTVSVEFKPAAAGALTASLSIADNATGTPQLVALHGTGVATTTPTVTLTPTTLAFPATIVGATSNAQIVTVKNTGTVTVTISSIVVGGTNATSFEEIGTCGTSLTAGASCSLYVAFKPTAAVALSGTISVTDNATGSPQKVTLTGTGTAAPSVKLSTTSIAFPTTLHGTTSAAQAVTITNGGTATLTLTSITLAGTNPTDFEALNTCGATLAPAANCVVYVAFKPATAAAFKATLSIADNGAGSPQSVALSGTGN